MLAALLAFCAPASAFASSGSAAAASSAGSGIGNAGLLTGTASGSIVAGSTDWWVIYPSTPGGAVAVTVQNNSADDASCGGIEARLYNSDGTRNAVLAVSDLRAGDAAQIAGRQAGADRYFVNLVPWGCASVAPYSLTPTGGGGTGTNAISGHVLAGQSIGTAWPPLQGHVSYAGTLGGNGGEDWYVLYKKADTSQATIRVQNTTANDTIPCVGINVNLYGSTGTRNLLQSVQMTANGSVTLSVPGTESSDGQGRYFLQLTPWGCGTGGQTYTMEPESVAEWANPVAVPSASVASGNTLATAWPPLRGGLVYHESASGAGTEDWFVLYKKQDTALATVRIQNTTVNGSVACGGISAALYGSGGTQNLLQSEQIATNGTAMFVFPGTEAGDTQGRYFLELTPWGCSPGGQTFTIEPESAAEWSSPARVPSGKAVSATTLAGAWPPLPGGVSSYQTLGNTTGQDWYVLYKKADSSLATVRVQDATADGAVTCTGIIVTLYGAAGTSDQLSSVQLRANAVTTFVLPGQETGSSVGRYYLQISPWGCSSLGQSYTIEPEAAGEFSALSKALPVGPSLTGAAGPLSGGTNYTAQLASASTQAWSYFHANGPGSLRVQNTTASSNACKTVKVVVTTSAGRTLVTATPASGAVATVALSGAGDFAVQLTTGGCAPKPAMSALLVLTGSFRGPALSVPAPTLKGAALHKAYSAPVKVSGGHAPYVFTAKTALPPGLSLNRTTGAVAGTPTKAGSYTFMVAVTDSTKPTHNTITVQIAVKVS